MAEYKLMYLKQQKLVTRAARPSLLVDSVGVVCAELWQNLPDDFRHARNIEHPTGEWGRDRSLGLGQ